MLNPPIELVKLAAPWSHLYSDSKAVEIIVTFAHIAGLLLGGGIALASDRATLRAVRAAVHERASHLEALASVHRIVLTGLAISVVSGILLFLSDLKTFFPSWVFWLKMSLIVLLLVNGLVMTRAEQALRVEGVREDARAWTHLHRTAVVSLSLWFLITLAGVVLMNL